MTASGTRAGRALDRSPDRTGWALALVGDLAAVGVIALYGWLGLRQRRTVDYSRLLLDAARALEATMAIDVLSVRGATS
jgi:hypothetical protein